MCSVIWLFAILCVIYVEGANNTKKTNVNVKKGAVVRDNYVVMMKEIKGNTIVVPLVVPVTRQKQGNATNTVTTTSSSSDNRRCVCQLGVCKCCTGLVLDLINQKACMRVTYHPGDFAFDVAMSLNNRILYENSMSGKNPRPICISPPRIPNLKVCAKFYNVFFPGRNFHFCLAMTGTWRSLELFNFAFDCLRMGANGLAMVKPQDNGGLPIPNPSGGVDAVIDSGDDIEDYDENVVKSLLSSIDDMFDR